MPRYLLRTWCYPDLWGFIDFTVVIKTEHTIDPETYFHAEMANEGSELKATLAKKIRAQMYPVPDECDSAAIAEQMKELLENLNSCRDITTESIVVEHAAHQE